MVNLILFKKFMDRNELLKNIANYCHQRLPYYSERRKLCLHMYNGHNSLEEIEWTLHCDIENKIVEYCEIYDLDNDSIDITTTEIFLFNI